MTLYDLDESLAELAPQTLGTYSFLSVQQIPEGLLPFATVREEEGITVIITEQEALQHGLAGDNWMTRISLGAFTSLNAVGITATIAQTLASRSIPCNVIAGYHHDHIFVPKERAEETMRLLGDLVNQAKGWLPGE